MAELSQAIAAVSASSISLVEHSEPPRLPINQLIEQDELPELVDVSSPLFHGEPLTAMVESQVDQSEPLLSDAVSSPLVDNSELPAARHLLPLPEEQVFSSSLLEVSEPLATMSEQRVDQSELLEVASSLPVDQSEPLVGEGEPLEKITVGSPLVGGADAGNTLEDVFDTATLFNEPVEKAAPSSELVEEGEAKLGQEHKLEALTSLKLQERLGVSNGTISKHKDQGNEHFREWSAELDRDGVPWEYREGASPRFHPIACAIAVTYSPSRHNFGESTGIGLGVGLMSSKTGLPT